MDTSRTCRGLTNERARLASNQLQYFSLHEHHFSAVDRSDHSLELVCVLKICLVGRQVLFSKLGLLSVLGDHVAGWFAAAAHGGATPFTPFA